MRCARCGHEINPTEPTVRIEDGGPVTVEVIITRGTKLCPYCYAVLVGPPDDDWLPLARPRSQKR